jgi:hypothetical protein
MRGSALATIDRAEELACLANPLVRLRGVSMDYHVREASDTALGNVDLDILDCRFVVLLRPSVVSHV